MKIWKIARNLKDVVNDFLKGYPIQDLAIRYKLPPYFVKDYIIKNIGKNRYKEIHMNNIASPEIELNIVDDFLNGIKIYNIAKEFSISESKIENIIIKHIGLIIYQKIKDRKIKNP